MRNIGKFIAPAEAKRMVASYVQKLHKPQEECAIGHLFSLNEVQKFMDFIHDHNSKNTDNPDKQIGGIRIYHGMDNSRTDFDNSDLFLMPVRNDGYDLYPVYTPGEDIEGDTPDYPDQEGEGGILGGSEPCPNHC